MAHVIADTDNIRQSFTGDGTTTITLGAAVPQFRALSSKLSATNTAFMVARCQTTGEISVGEFTYNGTTVTQTNVYYSSNANAAVAFSLGSACEIFLDIPSRWLEVLRYMNFTSNVLSMGANQATNPLLKLDFSAASVATGLRILGAAAGAALALSVISSGTNENLTIDAKGSGTIGIGSVSTGRVTITPPTTIAGSLTLSSALIYGGVTLSNAVTGTGNMVLSAGPTLTGTLAAAAATFSSTVGITGALTYGGATLSAAVTGTGSMVLSSNPTIAGTLAATAITASGLLTLTQSFGTAPINCGPSTGSVANGGSSGTLGVYFGGLIAVREATSSGDVALYLTGQGTVALVGSTGSTWVATTTTPAAGKASVANAGGSTLKIYNNTGVSASFSVFQVNFS